jgi:DNA-binding CsgD family transcriptional regulator
MQVPAVLLSVSSLVWITDRQAEILRLVARGMTSKEIARHEGISLHTVNTHVRRARVVLGVGTRAAAVALVVRRRRRRGQVQQPLDRGR